MKITIVGTAYPYRGGGIATYVERLAREFQAEGDEVLIETFTLQYPSFLFPGKTQYSDEAPPQDLRIRRSVNSCNPFNWLRVGRRLARSEAELIVMKFWTPFMAPCLGTIARLARRNKRTRVVAIVDNMLPHEHHVFDKVLAAYFAHSVDRFVVMSEAVLRDVELFDQRKPKTLCLHPLYDNFGDIIPREMALAHLGLPADARYMLFFGFIRDYKGLDLLMRAYAHPWFARHNVRLVVAGEFYNNRSQYEELERELGLAGRIIWRSDFIPNNEVAYYFNAADIVVQPYKSATQSGVTQVAYHFEKPMLVTDVGGLAEMVPAGKVGYVTPVDPNAIAASLIDFYEHDRAAEFRPGLLEEKKKYAWSNMTRAVKGEMES